MYTIGLGISPHDRSYSLVQDGRVLFAIEEERLTRVKHCMRYDASRYTLRTEAKYFDETFVPLKQKYLSHRLQQGVDYLLKAQKIDIFEVGLFIGSNLLGPRMPIECPTIPHHLAHASHAFFTSPFKKAAILVIDGAGEMKENQFETVSLYIGIGNQIKPIHKVYGKISHQTNTIIALSHSVGVLYQNASAVCGFGPLGAGKLMGLAPYGTPTLLKDFRGFVKHTGREVLIDNVGLYRRMKHQLSPYASFERRANVAASIQTLTEEILLWYADLLYSLTGCRDLCYAGGVALNATANTRLLKDTNFRRVYIPSAPGDNGISIGAALYADFSIRGLSRSTGDSLPIPYLGRIYSDHEINQALSLFRSRIHIKKYKQDIIKVAADLLRQNKVIAWFQEGSEFGPRALGHRSIFANPTSPQTRDRLNEIKGREWFRPVAPVVAEPSVSRYFSIPKASNIREYPYMLFIFPKKDEATRVRIPSAIHVDGTARVQTINKKQDPILYKLIETFYKRSGVPVLINTSFNIGNEPIVESPEDAVRTFLRSKIDFLIIKNYCVAKKI